MKKLLLAGSLVFGLFTSFGQTTKNQLSSSSVSAPSGQLNQVSPLSQDGHNHQHDGINGHFCKSHDLNQAHYEQRGLLNDFNQSALQGAQNVTPQVVMKTPGSNTISVIFHVVHNPNNPAENVSNATIMSIFNDISEDFQLLNADAANARTNFGFNPADANINFCLATQDPSGTPLAEAGVIRVSTTEDWYDSDNGEENKMKSSATGGSEIWDRNNYLNVWICDITNGANSGTAGYAYRPTASFLPSPNIDGIVIDYNLGVGGNVLTHEIGHYLGLDHTWGGSGGCTNDDGFGDTPQTAGPSFNFAGSCSGNQTTCGSTQTQYENYMDYSNCTVMFTQNQADYMLTILGGIRSSLLLSPGCDPVDAPPVVDFTGTPLTVPVGGAVNFTSITTNAPTSWTWDFGGGAPASTLENPNVTFNTAGLYTVTHTATNAFGTGTEIKTDYVNVVSPATGTACDTLRNWEPDSSFTFYSGGSTNGAWGYIPGHSRLDLYGDGSSVENTLQYAEQFNYVGTAEVRRLRVPFFIVDDVAPTDGSIEFRVYDNDNGANPGTVLASETVLLSDLTVNAFNEIDFTTPASVTGNFFVGVQLQYGAAQDTVLMGLTPTATGSTASFFMEMDTYGWLNTNLLGITESIAIDVLLSNGADPVANVTFSEDSVCQNGDVVFNGSNSTNVTDYFWYQVDDPITQIIDQSGNAGVTFNFGNSGAHAVILFADGSCKSDVFTQSIFVNDPVSATATPTATTCGNNNGAIVVTNPQGGNGNYEYSLDGNNWQASATFDDLPSGNYTVYVRTSGDQCDTTYSVNIGASTAINASASASSAICPGGSATISATGGNTYQWFDGSTALTPGAAITVSPAATTQYNCIVTDAFGCEANVFSTVTVYDAPTTPTISTNGSTSICQGENVELTSSYPSGNVWNDVSNSTGSLISVTTAGSYEVTYTDANGCSSTSAATVVAVNNPVALSEGSSTNPSACQTATGLIEVTGTGSGDISWTGTSSGSLIGVTLPINIPNLAAGSYNITLLDANGCTSNTLAANLTDPGAPAVPTISNSGANTFCDGSSVTLTSSYATGNVWTDLSGSTTQAINVTQSGTYSVTHTDGNGCSSSSAPVVINVNANPTPPTITANGATSVCAGQSVTLTSSQGTGNAWSIGGTNQNLVVSSTSNGITVTYTDGNGCSSTSTPIDVIVNPLPTPPSITANGSTAICPGQSVTLTSSEVTGNSWSTGGTNQSVNVSSETAGITVTYTDGNGCSATSAPIDVTESNGPTVEAGADVSICEGENVTLNATGASTYAWDNGVNQGQAFTPTTTTTYTVTGTDTNGCTGTDAVIVTVNAAPTVTVTTDDVVCVNHDNSILDGQPAGGTFFGVGVTGNEFSPSTAGVGTFQITYDYTDGNGCSNSAITTITVEGCASISEIETKEILVFPNPAQNQLTISVDGEFTVNVLDARGRIVAIANGTNTTNVDVSSFEMGIYFVTVNAGSVNKTVRIVKQ